jgi:hypothetical protein
MRLNADGCSDKVNVHLQETAGTREHWQDWGWPAKMLECRALSSRTLVLVGCVFCTLLVAERIDAAGVVSVVSLASSGVHPAGTRPGSVFADVHWVGRCDNRNALEHAMRKRGARLEKPGTGAWSGEHDRFTVDVDVRPAKGGHAYAARVSIRSETGAHDIREVDAERCEELHSAIAWVLAVLAWGPGGVNENPRPRDATTPPKNALPRSNSAPALGSAWGVRARQELGSSVRLAQGRMTLKEPPRFAMGAELAEGWHFVHDWARGPAVFIEHRPWLTRPVALRLTLLTLTNDVPSAETSIGVTVRRTAARLGGSIRVPGLPLALVSGLEAGLLAARGSGTLISHQSHSFWGSLLVGALLDLPLLGDKLGLEAGGHAALSPFTYAFHTSQRKIAESGPVEVRATLGLKSHF